jgi:hypothetical protein
LKAFVCVMMEEKSTSACSLAASYTLSHLPLLMFAEITLQRQQ